MPLYFRLITLCTNAIFVLFFISAFTNYTFGLIGVVCLLIVLRVYRLEAPDINSVIDRLGLQSKGDNSLKLSPILHRGGSDHFPENTVESIKQAKLSGAHGVEVDLVFTSDDVGVLFHDRTVDRVTDGHGYIADMTYKDLMSLDAAANHPCRITSGAIRIPTVEACLETCMEHDLMVYIDCKSKPKQTADLLSRLFKKNPKLYNKAIVCSFFPLVVYAVRKADPAILTGLTHRHKALKFVLDHNPPEEQQTWKMLLVPVLDLLLEWSHFSWFWFLCGNSFSLVCKDDLSRETCNFWRNLGTIVIPWTVNDQPEKDFFQKSLKCPIITDTTAKL